jgi:hypothetical protein
MVRRDFQVKARGDALFPAVRFCELKNSRRRNSFPLAEDDFRKRKKP